MEEYDEIDEFEAMEAESETQSIEPKRPPVLKKAEPKPVPTLTSSVPKRKSSHHNVVKPPQPPPQPKPGEVWVAFHQPEIIGIANTQTGERIEGFKDKGVAQAQAKILNDLNTVIVGGGYED